MNIETHKQQQNFNNLSKNEQRYWVIFSQIEPHNVFVGIVVLTLSLLLLTPIVTIQVIAVLSCLIFLNYYHVKLYKINEKIFSGSDNDYEETSY